MIAGHYVFNMSTPDHSFEILLQSSFAAASREGRADVRAARHLGPSQSCNCFDLEDVTSDDGGTGHGSSPTNTAAALRHVRDQQRHLAGIAFCMLPPLATHSWK